MGGVWQRGLYAMGNLAGQYLSTRLRARLRDGGSFTRTRNGRSGREIATTNQYDMRNVYRRKRMPFRRRRRWVKQIRKHRAIDMKSLATQTFVRNDANLIGGSGGQAVGAVELYGLNGSAGGASVYGQDDIVNALASWLGGTVPANRKFIFGSAVLDMTITNQGPSEGPTGTVEVDVYRCVYRKPTGAANCLAHYVNSVAQLNTMAGAVALTMSTRGWTPFNCPTASSSVKILSKKKFLLGDGQTATYQIRDPKNRYFNTVDFANLGATDVRVGYTQFLLMVVKHVPANEGPAPAFQVVFGCTRSYTFKVDEYDVAESGFGP